MSMIQGGPPEWIWERTPDPLKSEMTPTQDGSSDTLYEVRVNCGLGIMRLLFFTEDEIKQLQSLIAETLGGPVPMAAGRTC